MVDESTERVYELRLPSRHRRSLCRRSGGGAKRLAIIGGLAALEITQDAESLTEAIMAAGILPPHAVRDAVHVAVASVHAIDYLLTWNCKHLANAQIARRIAVVCEELGHRMPVICTPEELMGT